MVRSNSSMSFFFLRCTAAVTMHELKPRHCGGKQHVTTYFIDKAQSGEDDWCFRIDESQSHEKYSVIHRRIIGRG